MNELNKLWEWMINKKYIEAFDVLNQKPYFLVSDGIHATCAMAFLTKQMLIGPIIEYLQENIARIWFNDIVKQIPWDKGPEEVYNNLIMQVKENKK